MCPNVSCGRNLPESLKNGYSSPGSASFSHYRICISFSRRDEPEVAQPPAGTDRYLQPAHPKHLANQGTMPLLPDHPLRRSVVRYLQRRLAASDRPESSRICYHVRKCWCRPGRGDRGCSRKHCHRQSSPVWKRRYRPRSASNSWHWRYGHQGNTPRAALPSPSNGAGCTPSAPTMPAARPSSRLTSSPPWPSA